KTIRKWLIYKFRSFTARNRESKLKSNKSGDGFGNLFLLRKGIQHRRFNVIGSYGVLFERMRIEICVSRREGDSMQVTIIDERPQWMKDEDEMMMCMTRCSLFRRCRSRFGHRCKRL